MERVIEGISICYKESCAPGTPTVLLHGWGADMRVMQATFEHFAAQGKPVMMLDFPFFGQSAPPPPSFGVYDYARITAKLLAELGYKRANLLGHSFGGRIAIILAAEYDLAEKLVLVDAAGVKPRFSLKRWARVWRYKLKKRLGIASTNAGSDDYRQLPPFMRGVFVRIVNTHLDKLLGKITAPTLLIWGSRDRDTPPYMARRMQKRIPDSGIAMLDGAGHFSFLDCPHAFAAILDVFLANS